tara:strand:- start:996 stop:1145 length:150 start_codon:yes stop_codon:yes gene_type:complete
MAATTGEVPTFKLVLVGDGGTGMYALHFFSFLSISFVVFFFFGETFVGR